MSKSISSRQNKRACYSAALIRLALTGFIVVIGAACGVQVREEASVTATSALATATLPATPTQSLSETPPAPAPSPTVTPVEGVTSTQVNVRAAPSTAGNVLGMIPPNTKVEVTGRDPGGNWWQINYAQSPDGKGWVTAQYVTTTAGAEIPVIGGSAANPENGNVAVIQQQLNVRSGPGTDFNSLGTLNQGDVAPLTGKDANGTWLQIDFPQGAGPEGKGWVNAAFVQAQGVENLPIVTEAGQVVGTGTPTVIPFTPTPTVIPARVDNDAPEAPIVSVIFEPAGTQTLIYNGEVSAPQGDAEDWIAFRPYGQFVFISLECQGSHSIQAGLSENSSPIDGYIKCGEQTKKTAVNAGANYTIHVWLSSPTDELQSTSYILTVKAKP